MTTKVRARVKAPITEPLPIHEASTLPPPDPRPGMLLVRAVPGALVPDPRRVRAYYGWERCKADEAEHTIPLADGGIHFRRSTVGALVPDTAWTRLAIARGELQVAPPAEAADA